jgi:hypothetical protein
VDQALAEKCGRLSLIEEEKSFSPAPSPSAPLEAAHEVAATGSTGALRALGGSHLDAWNDKILRDAVQTLWTQRSDKKEQELEVAGAVSGLFGIAPKDELEGMIAAQLLPAHNAAIECYRRAMIAEQTFEGRRENLNQANKLSRTFVTSLEALNRHRGKGQQKVTVEHVHVHAGGQAVVGAIEAPGGGHRGKSEDQPHAKHIAHAPQPAVWGPDKKREPLPITCDAERPMPDARRNVTRGTEGK